MTWGAWLATSEEYVTLDLGVLSLRPTLGIEITTTTTTTTNNNNNIVKELIMCVTNAVAKLALE